MPTVLIAGLFHETHTFLDQLTTLDDFQITRDEALLACAGDGSPLGAALAGGHRYGWSWLPTVDYRAQPSGTVDDAVFARFWAEFVDRAAAPLRNVEVDAIYLVLHGAMVTQSQRDVEGEFLARLRRLPGAERLPIYGVYDLHANFTAAMARHGDCLVAYRENPHADACEMAMQAVNLLEARFQRGGQARTYWEPVPIIWPPSGTATSDNPMRELRRYAWQQQSRQFKVLEVNLCAGFAFADTPYTGVSFSVVTLGEEAAARELLRNLAGLAWELREEGNVLEEPADRVLARLPHAGEGLTVIAEPADNIGGGAPGDGTGLLRALVQCGVERAAICLCDPLAVARLAQVEIGAEIELEIGGRGSRLDPGPLTLRVELVARRDGRFHLEDPQSHLASMFGGEFDMGACAVVRQRGITILLTSRKTPPFDLGQWRSQGIEPARLAVIGVKAAVAHRNAFASVAARFWSVDTPGPCRSDLRTFPYRHVRRPIYPLDP